MTKITRNKAESTIINLFLTTLRANLIDVYTPVRTGSDWIRASALIRQDNLPTASVTGVTVKSLSRKRGIVKQSQKPDYPLVIVGDFDETNEIYTFKKGTDSYYKVNCELVIYITDVGNVTRIGGLAGQISEILKSKKISSFKPNGITMLEWVIISTPGYSDDNNEYNEKQIRVNFTARLTEWT